MPERKIYILNVKCLCFAEVLKICDVTSCYSNQRRGERCDSLHCHLSIELSKVLIGPTFSSRVYLIDNWLRATDSELLGCICVCAFVI